MLTLGIARVERLTTGWVRARSSIILRHLKLGGELEERERKGGITVSQSRHGCRNCTSQAQD